jgi:hypothetical protein
MFHFFGALAQKDLSSIRATYFQAGLGKPAENRWSEEDKNLKRSSSKKVEHRVRLDVPLFGKGGPLNLSQAKPAPKQLNLNKLSDAGRFTLLNRPQYNYALTFL